MAYEYAIETKMLKKIYGEQVAVNNVSLHIDTISKKIYLIQIFRQ